MDNRRFQCCEQVFAIPELVIWKRLPSRFSAPVSGDALRLVRPPANRLARPGRGGQPRARSLGTPPGVRSAADCRPAARSTGGTADLRRYCWRAITCRIYARRALRVSAWLPRVSGSGARCFRPATMAFPARRALRVSPPECRGVSPPVPQRFRPGHRGVSLEGRRRAGARSRRGRPYGPSAGARRRPLPGVRSISRTAAHDGIGPAARPVGGQPLTSGPARVRLIRRMTRRSRSIAAR
jgi:hypothetical protein